MKIKIFLIVIILFELLVAKSNILAQFKFPENLSSKDSLKLTEQINKAIDIYSFKGGLHLDTILEIVPESAQLWQWRAMTLYKEKKYSLGKPALDNAVKYDAYEWLDYRAFMECIFSKDYAAAITDFKAAPKICKRLIVMEHPYDFYLGICYLQINKKDSAEFYFNKTIADEKKYKTDETWIHYLHWFYLGIVKFENEDFSDAILCFEKSLKLYPNFSDAKFYKAICLLKSNQNEEAKKIFLESRIDYNNGMTFSEDNSVYETYPYQLNKAMLNKQFRELEMR